MATFTGRPTAVVSQYAGDVSIYAIGQDGAVWSNYWDGAWHSWFSLGGWFPQGTKITAVTQYAGDVSLYAVGPDGGVWSNYWDGAWHSWFSLGGSFPIGTTLTAVSQYPGDVSLYGVAPDGGVWSNYWDGSWHSWFSLGGVFPLGTTITPISQYAGDVSLYGVAPDGGVWSNYWDGSWHSWFSLGRVVSPGNGRVLYLNFDGVDIRRSDLERWAGGQWTWGPDGESCSLDCDRNGILVQPFRAADPNREWIISRIFDFVRADLAPFGVTVQRTYSWAIEGAGATTIFVGPASLTGSGFLGIAGDIDEGNNNRTDAAFVVTEGAGTVDQIALFVADVTVHEAGHTYGFWHVLPNFTGDREAMITGIAGSDREFRNEWHLRSGGGGWQNTYQALYDLFVNGTGCSACDGGSPDTSPGSPSSRGAASSDLLVADRVWIETQAETFWEGLGVGLTTAPTDTDQLVPAVPLERETWAAVLTAPARGAEDSDDAAVASYAAVRTVRPTAMDEAAPADAWLADLF